jgi:LysM repeat protein
MKLNKLILMPALLVVALALTSAQKRYEFAEETNTALREMRDSVSDFKHELNNHETEIKMLTEKLENQSTTLDSVRQQALDVSQANKDLVKNSLGSIESKVTALETSSRGLIADFKQLKTHANDSTTALEQYEQRIAKLEKLIEVTNRNLSNLENALTALTGAMSVKDGVDSHVSSSSASSADGKSYKVKNGDSLEKIAKNNGTTIKAIKELNQLTSDKIRIGQTLKLP